ncbi:MAG: hypothetical protein ACREEP_00895 [Dongiaceae bacterium]
MASIRASSVLTKLNPLPDGGDDPHAEKANTLARLARSFLSGKDEDDSSSGGPSGGGSKDGDDGDDTRLL